MLVSPVLPAYAQAFTEVSSQAGIGGRMFSVTMIGGGCAFFDYDNDGWLDIYLVGGLNPDRLYHNNRDGTFTEKAMFIGFGITATLYTMGVVTGDIDNDGWRDVFVTTVGAGQSFHNLMPNLLFRNNRNGTFTDISHQAGIRDSSWSVAATMGDYNLDGYLDIHVVNYVDSLGFIEDSITGDIIGYKHKGHRNFLYRNNGNSTFTNVAASMQVDDRGTGLATAFTDYDNDHDADIFTVNDFGEWIVPNRLYQNNFPVNSFTDVSAASGADIGIYGMGIATGDYDEDGDLDYYFTNIGEKALLNNSGSGTFTDVAVAAGVANGKIDTLNTTGWGCGFLDYDNDTWLDLFVANGYIPVAEFIATGEKDPKKLFKNNMDGTFTDVSVMEGVSDSSKGRGFAYGDYDNDGDLDMLVLVTEEDTIFPNNEHALLFRNDIANGNYWLKVQLRGTTSNRDGFGSRVEAYAGGRKWIREIDGGSSFASQHSSIAHFGLGSFTTVDSVVVIWPGGGKTTISNVAANQSITIVEGGNIQVVRYVSLELCEGDSIFAGGAWRKNNGTYYDTITSPTADSILITTLLVNPVITTTLQYSICEGDSILLGGSYQTESAIFHDTLLASKGCDSIVISELSVIPLQVAIADVFLCEGDSFFAEGAWQTEGGTYYDTFPSSGCNYVVITSVGIFPSFSPDTIYETICEDDSIFAGGGWQSSAGVFYDSFQTSFGCDSIVATEIELIQEAVSNLERSICMGDSLFVQGAWRTVPGIYYDSIVPANGCDSIFIVTLSVMDAQTSFDSAFITAGDSIYLAGAWRTIPGTYYDTLAGMNGCDSIVITELTVLAGITALSNSNHITVHPNPFQSGFTVSYSLPADDEVEIRLYSASGKLARLIFDDRQAAGSHSIEFPEKLNAGVYFISFRSSRHAGVVKAIAFGGG